MGWIVVVDRPYYPHVDGPFDTEAEARAEYGRREAAERAAAARTGAEHQVTVYVAEVAEAASFPSDY